MAYLGETTTFDKLKPGDVFRFGEDQKEASTYVMSHDGYFWSPFTGSFNDPDSELPPRKVILVVPEPPAPPAPVEPTGIDSPIIKFDAWMPIAYRGFAHERGRKRWYFTTTPETLRTWDELVQQYGLRGQEYTYIYPVNGVY